MKQGSNPRRGRNRGGGKRQSRNSNFDSNGPEGRVRGTAQQVFEKYQTLARDAQSAGDRVASENFFQHAEHYFRIMNADGDNGRDQNKGRRRNGEDGMNDDGYQPQNQADDGNGDNQSSNADTRFDNGSDYGSDEGSHGSSGGGSDDRREKGRNRGGNGNGHGRRDGQPQTAGASNDADSEQAATSQDDAPDGDRPQTSERPT